MVSAAPFRSHCTMYKYMDVAHALHVLRTAGDPRIRHGSAEGTWGTSVSVCVHCLLSDRVSNMHASLLRGTSLHQQTTASTVVRLLAVTMYKSRRASSCRGDTLPCDTCFRFLTLASLAWAGDAARDGIDMDYLIVIPKIVTGCRRQICRRLLSVRFLFIC